MKKLKSRLLSKKRNIIILTVVLIALCVLVALIIKHKKTQAELTASMIQGGSDGFVTRGDISNELSSSGTLSPKNTYSITSLVSGEIIEANFEEGDQVTEGQTLFVIDQSDISSDIESAERSLDKAQKDYDEAVADKTKALAKLNNGTILAGKSGYIKNLTLKAGDSVGKDTKIAELYNDQAMSFRAAFLDTDAAQLAVGQDMYVEINDTGELIPGRIKAISDLTETLDGGIPVKYVEIYVSNPGGITTSDTANAYTGDIHSLSSGTFSAMKSEDFKLDITENVTVDTVLVTEGQYVTSGTPLFRATAESLEEALRSINDSADNAEDSLKNAENQKTKLNETIDKYTITAPISGQVITKNMQVGEKVNNSSSTTSQLALIYDLSELTFQMSIDELDISSVKVGQEVKVTADAFEGKTFKGHVSNVGLNGTAQNGVTTYPVVVTMDEMDGLLPGMNVDGTIILESATDTLIIPSGALQRGNIVYVKDESLAESKQTAADNGEYDSDGADSTGAGEAASMENAAAADAGAAEDSVNASDIVNADGKDTAAPDNAVGTGTADTDSDKNHGSSASGSGAPGGNSSDNRHGNGAPGNGSGSGHGSGQGKPDISLVSGSGDNGGLGVKSDKGSSAGTSVVSDTADTNAAANQFLGDAPEGYTAVQVTTGIISNNYVEILSGLTEGMQIYVKDTVSDDYDYSDMFMGGGPGDGGGGHDGGGPGGP